MSETFSVEVVFATATRQLLLEVEVTAGTTVSDVIERSGISSAFPDVNFGPLQSGIWGRPVERAHTVREGDRVELYRPLEVEPREARRQQANR